MTKAELDYILSSMLDTHKDVSDLNFTVEKPPQVETYGELRSVHTDPPVDRLTPFQTEMIALELLNRNRRLTGDLIDTGSCDCSYALGYRARFRVNIFTQRGHYTIILRRLTTEIPTLAQLNMPPVFHEMTKEKTGMILVTGATGSGKSTTLAALLNELNDSKPIHIVTLEDSVEFVHQQKRATFNQREMGSDFSNFAAGLRAALRQAPKVILVGEMRDRETVEIGLSAAETGHLVMSTLHTINAGQTIDRIIGMFDQEEQHQIRIRMAETIRWIVSQRLLPRIGGGRVAALEIMGNGLRVKDSIEHGEAEGKTFYDIIEASATFGWKTFDSAVLELYENGLVTEETALLYCSNKGVVSRGIDKIKKVKGQANMSSGGLTLDLHYGKRK
ncbi:MAG TPA: PilT/PilU family type 4a pilus ATPase [Terriglobia bacterium]|nr:PilT/PilU family type 4a pilus ATPase [Terriglobia bacterium]